MLKSYAKVAHYMGGHLYRFFLPPNAAKVRLHTGYDRYVMGAMNRFSASAKKGGHAIKHLKLGKAMLKLSHVCRFVSCRR